MSSTVPGETPGQRSLRWILAAASIALFVGLARVFSPAASPAGPTPAPDQTPSILAGGEAGRGVEPPRSSSEPVLIGELVGRDYTLQVLSTAQGTRYTVSDADGRVLAEQLSTDDVYRRFPELDVRSLRLQGQGTPERPIGPLMLADPADPFE